ncbi:mechanosensitive ion channel protein 2, chloroplastic isoform X2 [Neltuma alba]|uniref:mechanosensitive ion channel protein 2, chloroplastic isoform X2 n=1 Tax=Neltuma alba TaxID=207710 RepID=UPI0010A31748|nr:mechanosensitive ion channel protein 2, chloroplastic-like isoform X2 [Prosopis alba]
MQLSHDIRAYDNGGCCSFHHKPMGVGRLHLVNINLLPHGLRRDSSALHLLSKVHAPLRPVPSRCNVLLCRSILIPGGGSWTPLTKSASVILKRSYDALQGSAVTTQLIPALGVIAFAVCGLEPLMRLCRIIFFQRNDNSWKKSSSRHIMTSYLQPLLLWTGVILTCRALDPLNLPSEASQAVKQRLLNFARSLSTVLSFAYCLSSLIQQAQIFFTEANESNDARNVGFDFAGKAVYTAVWVAAVSLFMELLGFSTQKWVTAGGLGTVLLTLAGREIFTNFLSSVMIHATRPFVVNEWIKTKIDGYEVSGVVEHVGWWSPTIVRGDDREAVHIPNHKFTVNVVRNLTQRTHWRIKTHLAISHLDVNKINILVSCFVKTSHFEEYLCVQEAILLDLLRVISHHRARLATPIRTVQKIYSEADLENIPFGDTIFTRSRAAANRPFLLIEPPSKVNGEDRTKAPTRSTRPSEEKDAKIDEILTSDFKDDNIAATSTSTSSANSRDKSKSISEAQAQNMGSDSTVKTSKTTQPRKESAGDAGKAPAAPVNKELAQSVAPENSSASSSHGFAGRGDTTPAAPLQAKQEEDKYAASPARPSLEENIVLGVALEGSKRTLPIDEEMTPPPIPTEAQDFAAPRNGHGNGSAAGKDKKDGQVSTKQQSD